MIRAVVITVSDSRSRGERADLSGPAVAQALEAAGFAVTDVVLVPDDVDVLAVELRRQAERARLVVTTGGTGLAPRDVTPEATRLVCDRLVDGIAEVMRSAGSKETPFAALSRGVCGTLGDALVLNLPGSPRGAITSLTAVLPLLPHALNVLAGNADDHGSAQVPDKSADHKDAKTTLQATNGMQPDRESGVGIAS